MKLCDLLKQVTACAGLTVPVQSVPITTNGVSSVVYGYGQTRICGGSMWIGPLRITGSDVSHVTESGPDRKRPCPEVCAGATVSCATVSRVFFSL